MTVWLKDDDRDLANRMSKTLDDTKRFNETVEAYYEGSRRARMIGISIPPKMRWVKAVVGWPGIAVDALEERLDLLGFEGGDNLGITQAFDDNELDVESGMAHLDALISGVSYVTVSKGLEGEPDVLISTESPKAATGIYDRRSRRLQAGLVRTVVDKQIEATLVTPAEFIEIRKMGDDWEVLDVRPHGFDEVPMVPLFNRRRNSRDGRTQITQPMRAITDHTVRTLLGMEVNREFYSAPQRWIMGATEEDFERTGWEIVLGKALALGRDEVSGELPQVGTFPANSPAPFVEQIRALSQLFAAEASVPRNYLGFVTENPSSADAIRAEEARLIKHAERRQAMFGASWKRVARLITKASGETVPKDFMSRVTPQWRDAATPTRAAAADAAAKLVGIDVLPPHASITLEMAGLDARQIARVQAERAELPPSEMAQLATAIARQG